MLRTNQNACYLLIEYDPKLKNQQIGFEFDRFTQKYIMTLITQDVAFKTEKARYPQGTFCVVTAKDAQNIIKNDTKEIIKRVVTEILVAYDRGILSKVGTNLQDTHVFRLSNDPRLGMEFLFPIDDGWVMVESANVFPLESVEHLVNLLPMASYRNQYNSRDIRIRRISSVANAPAANV